MANAIQAFAYFDIPQQSNSLQKSNFNLMRFPTEGMPALGGT